MVMPQTHTGTCIEHYPSGRHNNKDRRSPPLAKPHKVQLAGTTGNCLAVTVLTISAENWGTPLQDPFYPTRNLERACGGVGIDLDRPGVTAQCCSISLSTAVS